MKVVFSDRAFSAVLAETTEKIKTETGGLFLGVVENDVWYIVEAIDPGPKSIFEVAYFEYDQKYTQHLINKIANLYAHKLDLIGLWHRHPGSFDQFSSTDDGTNAKYACMRSAGAISGLVNVDPVFRFTMFHVSQPCRYQRIPYEVGDELIPETLLTYKTPDRYYQLMQSRLQTGRQQANPHLGYKRTVSLDSFLRFIEPVIQGEECTEVESNISLVDESTPEKLTEAVLDDLTYMADEVGIHVTAEIKDQFLIISQEAVDKTTKIYFMDSARQKQIVCSFGSKTYLYHSGMFQSAAKKAKAEKDLQEAEQRPEISIRRQTSVLSSVKKIIKNVKGEGSNDGD